MPPPPFWIFLQKQSLLAKIGIKWVQNLSQNARGGEWSLKNEKSRQILPKSQNLAQPTNGSCSLRFCVCRSYICFSIKSLKFSVSVSDFKMSVSASRRVSDLPFTTPNAGNGHFRDSNFQKFLVGMPRKLTPSALVGAPPLLLKILDPPLQPPRNLHFWC